MLKATLSVMCLTLSLHANAAFQVVTGEYPDIRDDVISTAWYGDASATLEKRSEIKLYLFENPDQQIGSEGGPQPILIWDESYIDEGFGNIWGFMKFMNATGNSSDNRPIYQDQIYSVVVSGSYTSGQQDLSPIPVPAAAWLFGSALIGLVGVKRRT